MNVMNYAVRDVITVAPQDSIDKALSLMEERGVHHLVVSGPELGVQGMVSDRDILLSTGWKLSAERQVQSETGRRVVGPTRVEQIMRRSSAFISNADDAADAARVFLADQITAAPVIRDGRLAGIITEHDLLNWLDALAVEGSAADAFLGREVGDFMRANVIHVAPETPIADIIDLFRRCRIRHAPVCAGGQLVGMVSDRDVRRALGAANIHDLEADAETRLLGPRAAHEIMQHPVPTIGPRERLREALRRMLEEDIGALAVEDDNRLVGIVTHTDFIRVIAHEDLL